MTHEQQTIVSEYVKEIASNMMCPGYAKRKLLKMISTDITVFVESNPSFSKDDLYNEFGSPKQYAKDIVDKEDYVKLIKREKKKMIVWIAVTAIIVALATYFIVGIIVNVPSGEGHLSGPHVTIIEE